MFAIIYYMASLEELLSPTSRNGGVPSPAPLRSGYARNLFRISRAKVSRMLACMYITQEEKVLDVK